MIADRWLSADHDFQPGAELFRSDRAFHVEAYTVSHGQLLLTSPPAAAGGTTVNLLFKRVAAMRLEERYDGLVVSAAATEGRGRVLTLPGDGYVVCGAFGWREGVLDRLQRSLFNPVSEADRVWPTQPVWGLDGGLGQASRAEVESAVTDGLDEDARRDRQHPAHVVVIEADDGRRRVVGVFLTEADAREAVRLLRPRQASAEVVPLVL
ncbi:hypothetical protein [Asanoa iriomotensis]|uniref:Uncharacterized protein n=1 Tax=Asanoa iriomotensis TaxID=234613 RepID=A0ABQ4CA86_9ACTN|nr:hypothetical protein [Asanoa iriomotensis]GIF59664.1 hypothetical protein Air01nite_57590 [Asanoa iriomotensis]